MELSGLFSNISGEQIENKNWWPGTELNRRRQPFQGCALPPELPGHVWLTACLPARLVWRARTWTELPVNSGSQDAGSVWNSHDYSNGVGFAQITVAIAVR